MGGEGYYISILVHMEQQHSSKCPRHSNPYTAPCKCDGYHSWDELYDHRFTIFIALCRKIQGWVYPPGARNRVPDGYSKIVWRSKLHADGTMYNDMFIMGIGREPGKIITYHLNMNRWDETDFAETLDKAPKWDGHTSDDVLESLKAL